MTTLVTPEPISKWAHLSFLISMVGKGLLGLVQIIGGLTLALTPDGTVSGIVERLARFKLIEDPTSVTANWMIKAAEIIHISNENFYTIYLLTHGALNFGLVLAILAGFRWAYPVSVLSLVGFIAYQLNKFAQTGDLVMIVLTVIDIIVIWLVWREWKAHQRTAL